MQSLTNYECIAELFSSLGDYLRLKNAIPTYRPHCRAIINQHRSARAVVPFDELFIFGNATNSKYVLKGYAVSLSNNEQRIVHPSVKKIPAKTKSHHCYRLRRGCNSLHFHFSYSHHQSERDQVV